MDHPLLAKARELFSDDETSHERIRAIDDEILFKVKVQRWRGAVWADRDLDLPWLIAAGQREDGTVVVILALADLLVQRTVMVTRAQQRR